MDGDDRQRFAPMNGMQLPSVERLDRRDRIYGSQTLNIRGRSTNIIDSDAAAISTRTIVLAAGADTLIEVLIGTVSQEQMLALIEQALYVGSVAPANLLPGGASISEADYQMIGPNTSLVTKAGAAVQSYQMCFQTYIRNLSASTVTLQYQYRIKYIANRGATLT